MPRRAYSRAGPIVAALFGFFVLCVPSTAQMQLSKSTKAAHDVFLAGYARTNNKCESIDPPSIFVDQPPAHGIICSRSADLLLRKTIENDLAHCLNRRAHGIHIIYLPREGYAGPDKVRYTVKFPTTQHTVEVNLTVLPHDPQSRNAVPADISAPIGDSSQSPGPYLHAPHWCLEQLCRMNRYRIGCNCSPILYSGKKARPFADVATST
jgi:hypothetical protein